TAPGSSIYRVTPALDRPDTLEKVSATEYRRHLPNGAYVSFDAMLRHVSTVNSLGHVTRFVWDSSDPKQLDSLVLPVPDPTNTALRRAYAFNYTSGLLTSVVA